ncbi:MAG TPA: DUF2949 domain-containing protein [Candidatus Obscuribacterales bacterium]|uniref:DUF2949 domain-containing protein n=1 Tax=Leptolyngbya sp. CCY15150 TaxID=2767772 RepID=UPI001951459D|nr:DUF2949 domain-containing protein [Leptolyngbya sp. CCY15150]
MNPLQSKLIRFLQADLDLSDAAIATALRQLNGQLPHLLPMVLWQYGLVTLEQLDSIFDWLETA